MVLTFLETINVGKKLILDGLLKIVEQPLIRAHSLSLERKFLLHFPVYFLVSIFPSGQSPLLILLLFVRMVIIYCSVCAQSRPTPLQPHGL